MDKMSFQYSAMSLPSSWVSKSIHHSPMPYDQQLLIVWSSMYPLDSQCSGLSHQPDWPLVIPSPVDSWEPRTWASSNLASSCSACLLEHNKWNPRPQLLLPPPALLTYQVSRQLFYQNMTTLLTVVTFIMYRSI